MALPQTLSRRLVAALSTLVLAATAVPAAATTPVPAPATSPAPEVLPMVTVPSSTAWRWCTKMASCPNGIVGGPSENIVQKTLPTHATTTEFYYRSAANNVNAVPGGYRDAAKLTPTDNGETFVVAGDGRIWHQYITGFSPSITVSGWSPMDATPVAIWGNVSVGINDLGNQELYIRGTDGKVYHNYSTPGRGSGWSGWSSMGTAATGIVGDIHVGVNAQGNQELYVVGTDGLVWHNFATPGRGSGWYGWTPMGRPTVIRGDVQLMLNDLGNQELYVAGTDGIVYHTYSTPGQGSGWSGWGSMGTGSGTTFADGVFTSYLRVSTDTWPYDRQVLYAVGNDNRVWANVANPGYGSGWTGWIRSAAIVDTSNNTVQAIANGYIQTSDYTLSEVYVRAANGKAYTNWILVDTTAHTVDWGGWTTSV